MKRIISNIIFLLTVLLTFSLFFLKGNIVFILPLVQILLTVITSIIDTRGLRDVFFLALIYT
jgi:hypothetical protein